MKKLFTMIAAMLIGIVSFAQTTVTKTVEELATANSWKDATVVTPFNLDEVISVSTEATDANTGKYYVSGQQVRLYQTGSAKLKLTAAEGYKISTVKLTYVSNKTGILLEAESNEVVTVNASDVTFSVGNSGTATNGQVRVTAFEVIYAAEQAEPVEPAGWDEIVFTEAAEKGTLNGKVFTAPTNAAFTLTALDTDSSKIAVDGSKATFGTADENTEYAFRLKTGGKSSSKNGLTLAIPADGTLRIAARTGSNSDETRTVVLKQGETELYNQVVKEADKVGDYYPYILVDVKQGTVNVEYPINSVNFYSFAFKEADEPTAIEVTVDNATVLEIAQSIMLQGQWNGQSVALSLWQGGATQGFGNYAATDFYGSLGTIELVPAGVGVYTNNGNGTFTFEAMMTDNTTMYDVTINGALATAHTYTVAGSSEALFGTVMDPTNTANDMMDTGEFYVWSKENVELPAGEIMYAVCQDHAMDVHYPMGGATLNIPTAGIYTVGFAFFSATGEVQALIEKTGDIVTADVYTVAGSSDALLGTAWDPANTANDMTLQEDGTYKLVKEGATLLAGDIEFKVCKDYAWTVSYPEQNYKLTIPADGIYTVTITFDPATKAVNATATKTGDAVIIPTIAMHGNFTGTWGDTENFTLADDNKTATLVLNLEATTDKPYEFGMRIGGKGNWTSNGVAFTRENASAVVVSGSGNLTLVADVAGEYTFTWTYETNTLAITFPAKEEPKPATWDEIVFTEVAAKGSLNGAVFKAPTNAAFTLTVTDTDASKLEVDENTASFGTAEENGTYTFRLKTGGKSSSKNGLTLAIPADGKLRIAARPGSKDATDRNIVVKQGETELYNQVVLEEKVGDYYSYVLVDVKQGTVTIEYPVNSLYLYAFGFQAVAGPTVGFENIEAAEKAVKFIENGQIFILRDGAVYNLMGARVK